MLNRRKTDKSRDVVDVTITVLVLLGWLIVVAINSSITDSSFGYSRIFGINLAIYAGLSIVLFFLLLPLVRIAVKPRWPWDVVISTIFATILGFIAYYAVGLAIFSLR